MAFLLRAVDPDHDVDRLFWDLTDCHGRSVLGGGGRALENLQSYFGTATPDGAIIIGAHDLELPADVLRHACQRVYVGDAAGNLSEIVEVPIEPVDRSHRPTTSVLEATYVRTDSLRVRIGPQDPDGDYVGAYVVYDARENFARLEDRDLFR